MHMYTHITHHNVPHLYTTPHYIQTHTPHISDHNLHTVHPHETTHHPLTPTILSGLVRAYKVTGLWLFQGKNQLQYGWLFWTLIVIFGSGCSKDVTQPPMASLCKLTPWWLPTIARWWYPRPDRVGGECPLCTHCSVETDEKANSTFQCRSRQTHRLCAFNDSA